MFITFYIDILNVQTCEYVLRFCAGTGFRIDSVFLIIRVLNLQYFSSLNAVVAAIIGFTAPVKDRSSVV
jgi:hypothetical protein